MLICAHCKSQSVVYDQEYVAGTGYIDRPRCLKCGRDKFKNIEISKIVKTDSDFSQKVDRSEQETGSSPMQLSENIAKKEEKDVGEKTICKHGECNKIGAIQGYCNAHFFDEFKITAGKYRKNKTRYGEDPRDVAARIQERGETKPVIPDYAADATPYVMPAKFLPVLVPVELYEKIVQLAEEQFRTPDLQAQYLIHRALREKALDE